MIGLISMYLMRWFGLEQLKAKNIANIVLITLIFVLLLIGFLTFKSCYHKTAKIDQENIQKINSENERVRKEELKKIIEENSDVVKTVDQRTEIVNLSVEERDRAINQKIGEADRKIQQVKVISGNVSGKDLECLLIPENCSK